MKTYDAIRTINPVKVGSRMDSFFAGIGQNPYVISNDGGPFISIKQNECEALVPLPNVAFLTPSKPKPKAEEKAAEAKK